MTGRAQHFREVTAAFQAIRRLPSISAGVLADGELSWTGTAGLGGGADVPHRIGSITKTMTAVLVMQCRDEGLLGLDDPLGAFIPESPYADVTLRALLSHTAGIGSEPLGDWWERSPGRPIATVIAETDTRIGPAGVGYHYSNTGFALLGEVVARLRSRPWGDLVAERIWAPLGMGSTTLLPGSGAARGWSVHHLRGTLTPEPATDTDGMAPAGQVWSTITDLARFAHFLIRGDGRVLPHDTLREMATPQPPAPDYGLGVMVVGDFIGHPGSMPGFQASLLAAPATGEGVVAVTNATTGFAGLEFTEAMLIGQSPGPVPPWVPTREVPEWAEELLGYWHWGNSAYELRWHNERLEFVDLARGRLAEQFVMEADAIQGHAGYHRGEVLHVVRNHDGTINHLVCATFVYTREPYDPAAPIPGR